MVAGYDYQPSLQVQVEYYTTLVKNGTARHSFSTGSDYALEKMEVNFLQPLARKNPPSAFRRSTPVLDRMD